MTAPSEHAANSVSESDISDLNDRITEAYSGELGAEFARSTRERIHWICSRTYGVRILDVGCSQGITSILLGRERRNVVGIDIASKPINEARNYLTREPDHVQSSVRFVQGDFLATDIGSEKFDTVIMGEVLEHLNKPSEFISAASKCLSENGTLIVTVPFGVNDWPDHKQTFYFVEPWDVLSADFNIKEVKFFGKWIGFVCRKTGLSDDVDVFPSKELFLEAERAFLTIERDVLVRLDALTNEVTRLSATLQLTTTWSNILSAKLYDAESVQRLMQKCVEELVVESELYTATICEILNNIALLQDSLYAARTEENTSDSQIARPGSMPADFARLSERFKSEAAGNAQRAKREQSDRPAVQNNFLSAESSLDSSENVLKEAKEQIAVQTNEVGMTPISLRQLRAEIDDQDIEGIRLRKEFDFTQSSDREAKTEAEYLRKMLVDEGSQRLNHISSINKLQNEIANSQGLLRAACDKLEIAQAEERSTRLRNDELKRQLQQSSLHALALRSSVEIAEKERIFAESRALRIRNMISFQLGQALIQASKSWQGFVALPGRLRAISLDARRRSHREPRSVNAPILSVQKPVLPQPIVFADVGYSVTRLKQLKIACIMDEFTHLSFNDEAILVQLSPNQWQQELETFQPEILFVESAWRGKDGLWGSQISHRSNHLAGVVEWCRVRKIPTIFWNKEDPVHYETFLNTATLFDHVFTTDIDCIGRYKANLKHQNVWFLPFACSTKLFNPIETYPRQNVFSFAGAFYARYPDRNRDLAHLITAISGKYRVSIYDRNYGSADPSYKFPVEFQPYIIGNLPYEKIDEAYKGYTYAINMNSIKQSQSMFARRVFELLGCNTITVSNFSRGIRNLFGDLVFCSDSGTEVMRRLNKVSDEVEARKFRLLGLRKILSEHTTQDRVAYIATKAFGINPPVLLPNILVVAYVRTNQQLDQILSNYRRQFYEQKRLCLIITSNIIYENPVDAGIHIMKAPSLEGCNFASLAGSALFIAAMIAEDYYGPNYLKDLALGTRYFYGQAVGKCNHYRRQANGQVTLTGSGQQYKIGRQVMARAALIALSVIEHESVLEWTARLGETIVDVEQALFIDEFNYCENGSFADVKALKMVDDADWYIGKSLQEIILQTETIMPDAILFGTESALPSADFAKLFRVTSKQNLTFVADEHGWHAASTLPDGSHEYVYAVKELQPAELGFFQTAKLHLETTPGLNIQFVLIYLDQQKQRLGHEIVNSNQNATCTLVEGTALVRLGLRLYGSGTSTIKRLVKDHKSNIPITLLVRSKYLVLSNHYPQYDDLYRNAFVHSRVKRYYNSGMPVDVFRFQQKASLSYHEFENIDIITGGAEPLEKLLGEYRFESIAVHFLDHAMWQVLERHIDRVRINVWIHGAEIQPWHRRNFNFKSDAQREIEKARSNKRLEFWRDLLKKKYKNLHFIFVSKKFSEEVMEDLGCRLKPDQYSIIHNPIDTDFFAYQLKKPFHRRRILSIRTYASRKYANDLSVAAILKLRDKPYFTELEFRLIGDGELFDEVTAPLKDFSNVVLEKRFVSHGEIVTLQAEYGVFLTPTRWDSHGVSRDEAMSSGLVAITNRVAAIPEFLDEECGYLAEAEDAGGLAAAIAELYENPEKFLSLSRASARRVREQCSAKKIIQLELALITGEKEGAQS